MLCQLIIKRREKLRYLWLTYSGVKSLKRTVLIGVMLRVELLLRRAELDVLGFVAM